MSLIICELCGEKVYTNNPNNIYCNDCKLYKKSNSLNTDKPITLVSEVKTKLKATFELE